MVVLRELEKCRWTMSGIEGIMSGRGKWAECRGMISGCGKWAELPLWAERLQQSPLPSGMVVGLLARGGRSPETDDLVFAVWRRGGDGRGVEGGEGRV